MLQTGFYLRTTINTLMAHEIYSIPYNRHFAYQKLSWLLLTLSFKEMSFFGHRENILLAMLCDPRAQVRKLAYQ